MGLPRPHGQGLGTREGQQSNESLNIPVPGTCGNVRFHAEGIQVEGETEFAHQLSLNEGGCPGLLVGPRGKEAVEMSQSKGLVGAPRGWLGYGESGVGL